MTDEFEDEDELVRGYWCVVCGKFLPANEDGAIIHDDVPHPPDMDFKDDAVMH